MGAPAARSVLLTVLGEYVAPRGREVWLETLVGALEALGYRTQAARQALTRSVSGGWLTSERHGRRSRLSLTPPTAEMLRSGARRIYAFGDPWEWDDQWLLIVLRVAEERREVRHQIRTTLAWEGFGSLGGGLWVSPHVGHEGSIQRLATEHAGHAELISFRAGLGSIGDPRRLVAQAWDLESVASTYEQFIAAFGRMRADTPERAFRAQTLLVHAWRKFPFLDPEIPAGLLPARWPRDRAHALFSARHATWAGPAQEFFAALDSSARNAAIASSVASGASSAGA